VNLYHDVQPTSEQIVSESTQPTFQSEPKRVEPKKGGQSNHYWVVDSIGKE